jgi:hypothetical protein
VTAHSVNLTGLSADTLYHFQVKSRDAQGNLAQSGDYIFTTASAPQTLFHMRMDASELAGTANGATITPETAPYGFTGKLARNSGGSVNFAPAQDGNGAYFLNCCANTGNAYYKFTGAGVGSIFNVNQGAVTFYLKSRYSFVERSALGSYRTVFDVRDNDNTNHAFYFLTQAVSGRLMLFFNTGFAGTYYYVPKGNEDSLFGAGVTVKVTLTWDGAVAKLYLNNALATSQSYTKKAVNWTAASTFDVGAWEYMTYGGYDSCDDIIDEFTVFSAPLVATSALVPSTQSRQRLWAAATSQLLHQRTAATSNRF